MTQQAQSAPQRSTHLVPVLFTMTIFLSAAMLFFVQPLFTKIVLPYVGGAPAVWTTAMLFFQTVLILGYLYAHLSTRYLPVAVQIGLHLMLWAIALTFLPLSITAGWQFDSDQPIALQTLTLFAFGVGMPFAVLSANAPLIQSWYAKSGGPSADDPYFLYGASNLGSLIALLAFPLIAEPMLGARQIGNGWAGGFVILGLFLALSGLAARKGAAERSASRATGAPGWGHYAWWLILAFVPSSLMLAVTSKISTDLGSFPLIWVVPLALYLLTFVLTFTNRPLFSDRVIDLAFVISLAFFATIFTFRSLSIITLILTLVILLGFVFVAMKAHRSLYAARPDQTHLTLFYVTMSLGGALGGLFNSLIAPVVFADLQEGRVTILLALLILAAGAWQMTVRRLAQALVAAAIVLVPVLIMLRFPVSDDRYIYVLHFIFLGLMLAWLRRSPLQQVIVLAILLLVGPFVQTQSLVFQDRSFFGSHRIYDQAGLRFYSNGTTIHGAQQLADLNDGARPKPLYYYHPAGPMAQIMTSPNGRAAGEIGIVGLGVGSLACYAQPGQTWDFYEIDQLVDSIARDADLFTFMSSCAPEAPTHIGDARVVLDQQAEKDFDVLVIDAYSSDAVPVHLTTTEAIALYRDRIDADGVIVLHISNRYFDIARPLGRSAAALGLMAMIQHDPSRPDDPTHSPSTVVVMAKDAASLTGFIQPEQWQVLQDDGGRIWTDDYANLLSILN
ncbi:MULTISPECIES: fused MFS/spermidine synthase [unclassified Yoonia]|uniref:fused MFS/spermidine synthase n=1 Tax=unclassified Yoonia TaxID=2629118 RepID=UPI002AFEC2C2|nr:MULTISPECIES: fused MFS/spermidine synthase [unclassified Yoonia]